MIKKDKDDKKYTPDDFKRDFMSGIVKVMGGKFFLIIGSVFTIIFFYLKEFVLWFVHLIFGNGNGNH